MAAFLRFEGDAFAGSEVCGVCFDPSGTRMYFTSQRAYPPFPGAPGGPGVVLEVSGPFRLPAGGQPADFVFGPPAGEVRPNGPLNPGPDRAGPSLRLGARRSIRRSVLARGGLPVRITVDEAAEITVLYRSADLARLPGRGGSSDRPRVLNLVRATERFDRSGEAVPRLLPGPVGRRRLRRNRRRIRTQILAVARDGAGNTTTAVRELTVGPAQRRRRRGGRRGSRRARPR